MHGAALSWPVGLLAMSGAVLGAPAVGPTGSGEDGPLAQTTIGKITPDYLKYPVCTDKNRPVDTTTSLDWKRMPKIQVQAGDRPQYLVNDMVPSDLKRRMMKCLEEPSKRTKYSFAHRGGGTLLYPEETVQSMLAGHRMGAGVQECDVTFTADGELVCRHSQCDLHTTTNILMTGLRKKCKKTWEEHGAAGVQCCTSDITLEDYKTLCGKMDGENPQAQSREEYVYGTKSWQTNLYNQCGSLMTYESYIDYVEALGVDFTPELKKATFDPKGEAQKDDADWTFDIKENSKQPGGLKKGDKFERKDYQRKIWQVLKNKGIDPKRVFLQSFHPKDLYAWRDTAAKDGFYDQAFLLDESLDEIFETHGYGANGLRQAMALAEDNLDEWKEKGIHSVAPPLPYIVQRGSGSTWDTKFATTRYADKAMKMGFNIVTWSVERSPPARYAKQVEDFYYGTFLPAQMGGTNGGLARDGDLMELLYFIHERIGVKAMFSDWSGTVTFFANCLRLPEPRFDNTIASKFSAALDRGRKKLGGVIG